MCFGGKDDGGAAQFRAEQEARERRITQGAGSINSSFDSQFNDDFYGGIKNAFLEYANPQLEQQLEQQKRDLAFALARSGTSQSAEAARRKSMLDEQTQLAQTQLADKAMGYANNQRDAVENARSALLSQNTASADPAAAAAQAASRAAALSQMPEFSSLGVLFQNITDGLATQADLERRGDARYNTGIFSSDPTSNGSGRVIR